jgi:hypothetical protein
MLHTSPSSYHTYFLALITVVGVYCLLARKLAEGNSSVHVFPVFLSAPTRQSVVKRTFKHYKGTYFSLLISPTGFKAGGASPLLE